MMDKILTDAELAAIAPIEVGHNHQRNPFYDQIDTTAGAANAQRWYRVHGWWVEEIDPAGIDPLAALASELAILDTGWHRYEHPATGALTLLPFEAAVADEWEARCREMHDGQQLIELEDKPTTSTLSRPLHHTAGQPVEDGPLNFEDTEESARLRSSAAPEIIRGD